MKFNKLVHPDVHFVFPIVKSSKGKREVCDDYIADWRPFVLKNPYFNLNHWLREMDAENAQAIIYAKESDEILKKLSLKSSEGGFKMCIRDSLYCLSIFQRTCCFRFKSGCKGKRFYFNYQMFSEVFFAFLFLSFLRLS